MKIEYRNKMTVADYHHLRRSVGWPPLSERMAAAAVENSAFLIAGYVDETPVAMARAISDGGYLAIMYDIIVTPACQGQRVGQSMIAAVKNYFMKDLAPGEKVMLHVMSAKDKEGFYQKLGFRSRPDEELGAGMTIWLEGK